ncbi:hypothetical protein EYF80_046026 [Liparis tanakae]|uniref:Uncharacterized protein n=1 Tax=Liparis tanakae TaxID=230148 RepID=A0A4Z2FRL0_9TELE|nr:hypothetical protein EYF80_046026 [Liparis tanakae]
MLAVMNLASETTAAVSSRPSFLIFQFLSPILDSRSPVHNVLYSSSSSCSSIFLLFLSIITLVFAPRLLGEFGRCWWGLALHLWSDAQTEISLVVSLHL